MKLINPSVELIQQAPSLVGMYKHIERCARTCYKSENKITEDSYKKMYNNLVQRGHLAMLEHGTIYLYYKECCYSNEDIAFMNKYKSNPYSKVISLGCDDTRYPDGTFHDIMGGPATGDCEYVITTNLRVIIENHWEDDLQYICEPTEFHERRITLKFTTNIGVTREGNRHRVNSIAEESTRYCNYNTDKFDNSIKFTLPTWIDKNSTKILACKNAETESKMYSNTIIYIDNEEHAWNPIDWYLYALSTSAFAYKNLIRLGWSPQQAREVLPLATKSEVVYTAFVSNWKHWFDLRLLGTTGKPHPNMEQIARLAKEELIKNNLWNLIYPENERN